MLETRCLCGDHVWKVETPLAFLHHCHCTYCRKHQGSAFTTMGAPAKFEWVSRGDVIEYASSSHITRFACAKCGSCVPGDPPKEGPHFIHAGAIEGDPASPIDGHLFAATKAPWFEIDDGLHAFDGYPTGYDAPIAPTPEPQDPPQKGELRGSCLCGRVRFIVTDEPIIARHCHCMRCRRARSALHASNYVVAEDGFRFTAGEELVRSYKVPEAKFFTQAFCSACGSAAPVVDSNRGIAVIPMGALDDAPKVTPSEHIFVGSRATWYDIPDSLPQHDEGTSTPTPKPTPKG